jgi:hypothetical protein
MSALTERRVYHLSPDLLARIRAFQTAQSFASETEAIRQLLTDGLRLRATLADVLAEGARYVAAGRLPHQVAEALLGFAVVTNVSWTPVKVSFTLASGMSGSVAIRSDAPVGAA